MNEISKVTEAPVASQEGMLAAELFLRDNYRFRRNVLNGKVEYQTLPETTPTLGAESGEPKEALPWVVLTQEAQNSIILRAKRADICDGANPKTDIVEILNSNEVPMFDPIKDYLSHLPKWDGQNHIVRLFSRLPGVSSEQQAFLSTWFLSTVAHWLQMDTLHGNECVPTLIGSQGCGKTTFVRRMLPPHLRGYYLDHLNLSNKFDKEMALTNNLLVNLDELEAIRPSQHASLKQTLSKSKVNGRPIYGCSQEDRPRYASFVATTNNPHPLTDVTGSRRYICINIPQGQFIDNTGEIDYEQLYAQALYELKELKSPYWFNNEEVARIQELNLNYMGKTDIGDIVEACFRKPQEGEKADLLNSGQMLQVIRESYPSVKDSQGVKIKLGLVLKAQGFARKDKNDGTYYYVMFRNSHRTHQPEKVER